MSAKSSMAKTIIDHSTPKSAMAMAIVAIPVAPPLSIIITSWGGIAIRRVCWLIYSFVHGNCAVGLCMTTQAR